MSRTATAQGGSRFAWAGAMADGTGDIHPSKVCYTEARDPSQSLSGKGTSEKVMVLITDTWAHAGRRDEASRDDCSNVAGTLAQACVGTWRLTL
ncbi:hypothetical protein CONPUDRAFT_157523 [Coniophora puteana RWD-64-598 SS2]|uniref:Uncharacterized protein n=1 Tax=Coniophora puteana (strain RWD-64-598) TaxID=741705 RepID=A0A5M3MDC9_CONPW|nr:uncharacterized protein CONPUDRAFT_157523 [Coniophora puteana RWD-64-598 SS2]EIW77262.1 hypothetical protein CONPUDRAFT_157523 [Coniophora puteana RWD-64-598 SS2]